MLTDNIIYGETITAARYDNSIRTKYLRLRLLHHRFVLQVLRMSLHYSTYSTCCIEATVRSIRYFNSRKNQVAFSAD